MTEALILAAGRGERLRPLTDRTPKALVEVGGRALIEHHLVALASAGVTRVVINLGWLGEHIVTRIGDGRRYGVRVVYSPEGYPTLDTGGAIVRALGVMAVSPFWVVNADVRCDYAFDASPEALLDGCQAAIGLVDNPHYRDDGDFALRGKRAVNEGDARLTFSGIACYSPAYFDNSQDGRFSVVPLLRDTAAQGALAGFRIDADWFDVGTPERLAAVRSADPH